MSESVCVWKGEQKQDKPSKYKRIYTHTNIGVPFFFASMMVVVVATD